MGVLSGMIAGAFGGFIGINLLAWVAKRNSRPHDLTSFTSDHNVIARIEDWAQAHGYRLVANNAGTRLYRKGRSILTAPHVPGGQPARPSLRVQELYPHQRPAGQGGYRAER